MECEIEHLFKTYYKALCHFAWQKVGDADLAKDISQDAFVILHKNIDRLELNSEVAQKNFLYTTVKHICLNYSRKSRIEDRYWRLMPFSDIVDEDLDYEIMHAEVMSRILSIIETMPNACQQIFKKGYLEGMSNLKIAEDLKISIHTVKAQKRKGMQMIRMKLRAHHLLFFQIFM